MRRALPTLTASLTALVVAAASTVALAGAADAAPGGSGGSSPRAERALDNALSALGRAPGSESSRPADRDATLALRDLALLRSELTGRDRDRADGLLARPTQGAADPYGDGYRTSRSRRVCGDDVCVHWVESTSDVASTDQARRTRDLMEDVHDHHTDTLGYRSPVSDGTRGGDSRFDVYLADVGADGLYGYCAPDDVSRSQKQLAGFCVLDNDYDPSQYGPAQSPEDNLRVTAAHEYFHAVQYAYDAREDVWLLEATATWVEEQYADDVDDNRQYLRGGQLRQPQRSLDRFSRSSPGIYGNWIFIEHLANRFGVDVVRDVFQRAGRTRSSVPAVEAALAARDSSLRAAYTLFSADNTVPGRSRYYPEGGEWGLKAPMARSANLSSPGAVRAWDLRLDHLTSATVAVRSRGLADGTRLRLRVLGPAARTRPGAYVIVHRTDKKIERRPVRLDASGDAWVNVAFDSATIDRVTLTVANGSAGWNQQPFTVRATALR